jgi:YhgE/Pip-like protein
MAAPEKTTTIRSVRAAQLLRRRQMWIFPLVLLSALIVLVTLLYFGAIVDPSASLRGLPVAVVNQDTGAATSSGRVNVGDEVVAALTGTPAVNSRLAITVGSLSAAQAQMNKGDVYATVVVPAGFTSSVLALASGPRSAPLPAVELLANIRAGSLGVGLAEGVLEPALDKISRSIGAHLASAARASTAPTALLADPVTVSVVTYRPLPDHSGLGLSAFYIALLLVMCGFLGGTIVNTSVDAALGYATSEVGPWWTQRLPMRITRWQTLLAKWTIAVPATLLATGLLIAVAAGILRMDAPHWFELWMYGWFAAAVVAIGTLALFAALGAIGQLLGLLIFVYLALASSGGTVPIQALPAFFRFVAIFEPLRQILSAVRAILYFDAMGDAGLDRGLILTAIGLVFWVVVGVAATRWYDRKGYQRLRPEILEYAHSSVAAYHEQRNAADPGPSQAPAQADPANPDKPAPEGRDGPG